MRPTRFVVVIAAAVAALAAGEARADVGVIVVVGDGLDPVVSRRTVEKNIGSSVSRLVSLQPSGPGCDAKAPDAHCIDQLVVASKKDIDEVALVFLKRVSATSTQMTLKVLQAGDWQKPVLEVSEVVPDADATNGATAVVKHAFDPAHYSGPLFIDGAPAGSEYLVDGLAIEGPSASLSVGKHAVTVTSGSHTFVAEVDIEYNKAFRLAVPPFAADEAPTGARKALWPRWVAGGVGGAGVVALIFGASIEVLYVHSNFQFDNKNKFVKTVDNVDAWTAHARDTIGFLPAGEDDPRCTRDGGGCVDPWSQDHYGVTHKKGVSEAAHFTMTAVSRKNELVWRSIDTLGISLLIGGAVAAVAGGGTLGYGLLTTPSEEDAPVATTSPAATSAAATPAP